MIGLTPRMRECLDFIRAEVREKGVMPTYGEISRVLGNSTRSATLRLIEGLEARGYLHRTGRNRGLKLLQTEYDHRPNDESCPCPRCPARLLQYQQIIQGLQSDPEFLPGVIMIGIRRLDHVTRADLLGKTNHAAPRKRAALPAGAR